MTVSATSTSTPALVIRRATSRDLPVIVETLATGFHDGDFAHWLIPDPIQRAAAYPAYFKILTLHALHHSWIDITADGHAVAIWHPIRTQPSHETPIPEYGRRLANAVGPHALPRFQTMDEAMDAHHPAGRHHYLGHLAVRPHRRGRGLGTALLAHHQQHLDQHDMPAYLEATGIRNQALYLRNGYQPMPGYRLTGNGPTVLPMWRDPNPAP